MDEKPRRRRFRFGLRTLFEIIAVVAFVLTLVYYRQTTNGNSGRYELHVVPRPNSALVRKWVIDTHTGQVWRLEGKTSWIDEGGPPVKAK